VAVARYARYLKQSNTPPVSRLLIQRRIVAGVPVMNVCIVNSFFPPHVSGSARLAFLLSEELSRRGHRVVVITSRIGGTHAIERRGTTTIYRLRSMKYPKIEMLYNADLYYSLLPQNLGRITGILRQHRIDVVQTFGQFQDMTFMTVLACRILDIPVALSIHTRMEHPKPLYNDLFAFADKLLVRHLVTHKAKAVVALDRQMREYIVERYNVEREVVRFIPTAVDVARFEKCEGRPARRMYALDDKQSVILSLGSYRSPTSLIRALPDVQKKFPRLKLLLVGAIRSAEPVHLVKELGLEKSVIFTGRVDYGMIPFLLGACNVEGHDLESGTGVGLASLEGMAAGKAVLSSAREDNFINLKLENWKNIVLVRPGNIKDISDALIQLLSDEKLRDNIGRNARAFVTEHFSIDAICRSYETLYRDIVGSHA